MRPQNGPVTKLGVVSQKGNAFYAHFQYRDHEGKKQHILGPFREEKHCAEKDLASMREAAEAHKRTEKRVCTGLHLLPNAVQ